MQKRMRIEDVSSEPFHRLGGRLVSLCRKQYGSDVKVKIITVFSDRDPGRGNAILWLTKHFGVFPMEMGGPDGELALQDLAELTPPTYLTLIIQAIPLFVGKPGERNSSSTQLPDNKSESPAIDNLKAHVPILKGVIDSRAMASMEMLNKEIVAISQYLSNDRKETSGPIIYLAGFSILDELTHSEILPSSKIIPWYLLLGDESRVKRIYRQPELNLFLGNLPEYNPRIVDLESIIADMEKNPNHD